MVNLLTISFGDDSTTWLFSRARGLEYLNHRCARVPVVRCGPVAVLLIGLPRSRRGQARMSIIGPTRNLDITLHKGHGCVHSRTLSAASAGASSTAAGASSNAGRRRPSTSATATSLDDDVTRSVPGTAGVNTLDQRATPAVRISRWTDKHGTWTRSTLDREREAFFDTRVNGYPYIWEAIHSALKILWEDQRRTQEELRSQQAAAHTERDSTNGHVDPAAGDDAAIASAGELSSSGIAQDRIGAVDAPSEANLAQTSRQRAEEAISQTTDILTRLDVTIPSGLLSRGVFDALGNMYELRKWVISDPVNLPLEDDIHKHDNTSGDDLSDEMELKREEKGKGLETPDEEKMPLRIRLSTGKDLSIEVGRNMSANGVRRRIASLLKLRSARDIRLFARGAELRGSKPLLDQGWHEGEVITALVFT